ncbi:hypothetical protein ACH4FA_03840 [Streptomyces sp. NPDC017966]|uniref:hypothetical protein n=1 Tax=Streptomyces sp. NPDC017966 TaxID=3365023 RepID=UPI0037982785
MAIPAEPGTGAENPGTVPEGITPSEITPPPESGKDDKGTKSGETNWQAEAEKWKAQARKHEDRSKSTNSELQRQADLLAKLAQKAGIELDDGRADPEKLAQQLSASQDKARQSAVELAVYRAAGKHSADADALLDSRGFLKQVDGLDPDSDDFAVKVGDAIKAAVESNPKLKTAPAPPARSGTEMSGRGEGARKPTNLADAVAARMRGN